MMKSKISFDYGDIVLVIEYDPDYFDGPGTGDHRVMVLPTYEQVHGWK